LHRLGCGERPKRDSRSNSRVQSRSCSRRGSFAPGCGRGDEPNSRTRRPLTRRRHRPRRHRRRPHRHRRHHLGRRGARSHRHRRTATRRARGRLRRPGPSRFGPVATGRRMGQERDRVAGPRRLLGVHRTRRCCRRRARRRCRLGVAAIGVAVTVPARGAGRSPRRSPSGRGAVGGVVVRAADGSAAARPARPERTVAGHRGPRTPPHDRAPGRGDPRGSRFGGADRPDPGGQDRARLGGDHRLGRPRRRPVGETRPLRRHRHRPRRTRRTSRVRPRRRHPPPDRPLDTTTGGDHHLRGATRRPGIGCRDPSAGGDRWGLLGDPWRDAYLGLHVPRRALPTPPRRQRRHGAGAVDDQPAGVVGVHARRDHRPHRQQPRPHRPHSPPTPRSATPRSPS